MEIGVSSERQVLRTTSGAILEDLVGSQPRARSTTTQDSSLTGARPVRIPEVKTTVRKLS